MPRPVAASGVPAIGSPEAVVASKKNSANAVQAAGVRKQRQLNAAHLAACCPGWVTLTVPSEPMVIEVDPEGW